MSPEYDRLTREIERLNKRLERERATRLQAETIAEKGLRELYEKQRQLELLAKIAAESNKTGSVAETLQFALTELCRFNNWDFGHAYLTQDDSEIQQLVSAKVWYAPAPTHAEAFLRASEETAFPAGIGLPGRVLVSKKPVWVSDVGGDGNFPRFGFAFECGLKAAAAFPVLSGDSVVAVLEFFSVSAREPNERVLDLMAQIGVQLGRVIERRRAEESLKEHAAQLMRARDAAKAADRMKSAFLATISHELRTPLNAIIGFADILKCGLFGPLGNPQYEGYAGDILASGKRLLALINDVLDVSRLDANALDLNDSVVDLAAVIEGCLLALKSQADKGGVALSSECDERLTGLRADEKRLRQILYNLISNAIKFTRSGGKVQVSVGLRDECLAIEIADTGIGMAQAEIPYALERFAQVDSRLNRKYEGSGLGLPLAKDLVELHGGTLTLASAVNTGTTVTVIFPKDRVIAASAAA
jgi:signal transduction histidine kinase